MLLAIPNAMSESEVTLIKQLLEQEEFKDGKLTAGGYAKSVKNNEQLTGEEESAKRADAIVKECLQRNKVFSSAVLPRKMRPPIYARYTAGMEYGAHVDEAIMGLDSSFRSDVSCTIFLEPPDSYSGGELIINTSFGEKAFKLPPGGLVIYPSTSVHRVNKVTHGRRQVIVTWFQSLVRSSEQREILFDLNATRQSLYKKLGNAKECDILSKSYSNLLRLWSEP